MKKTIKEKKKQLEQVKDKLLHKFEIMKVNHALSDDEFVEYINNLDDPKELS